MTAMQAIIAQRDSEVVEIIEVPTEKHRSLIGRGGETKKNLETKFNVSIDIPRQGNGQTGVKISGQPREVASAKEHILGLVKDEGESVQVPRNLHHVISDNGQFFRKVKKDYGVTIEHGGDKVPPKPAGPSNTRTNGAALPLITDNQEASADAFSWNVISAVDPNLDGDIPWILRGSPDSVPKAKQSLTTAIEQAQKMTHNGYLVLPDPRTYRFVIGQGGSKVNNIRKQTGCKINVPRDQAKDEAIEVSGTAEGVEQAKELILQAIKDGINHGSDGNRA
jgi:polyribonucleotide nucleotidyltransferase